MATCQQAALEQVSGLGADAANVRLVQIMGVRLVNGPMPRDVRKALMAAVRRGELGHFKKEGLMPEAFFHVNSKWPAVEARNRARCAAISALQKVCGRDFDLEQAADAAGSEEM